MQGPGFFTFFTITPMCLNDAQTAMLLFSSMVDLGQRRKTIELFFAMNMLRVTFLVAREETVAQLLSRMFDSEKNESVLVNGLCVIHTLLEVQRQA